MCTSTTQGDGIPPSAGYYTSTANFDTLAAKQKRDHRSLRAMVSPLYRTAGRYLRPDDCPPCLRRMATPHAGDIIGAAVGLSIWNFAEIAYNDGGEDAAGGTPAILLYAPGSAGKPT